MMRSLLLGFILANDSIALAKSVPLRNQISLVGFIRVGEGDRQSLVVLKTKDNGRTMILRRDDQIPGTAFRITSMGRDHMVAQGPDGSEEIAVESIKTVENVIIDDSQVISESIAVALPMENILIKSQVESLEKERVDAETDKDEMPFLD